MKGWGTREENKKCVFEAKVGGSVVVSVGNTNSSNRVSLTQEDHKFEVLFTPPLGSL